MVESAVAIAQLLMMILKLITESMTTFQKIFDTNAGATKKELVLESVKALAGEENYVKIEVWVNLFIDLKKAVWKLFGNVPASDPIVIQPLLTDIVVPADPV